MSQLVSLQPVKKSNTIQNWLKQSPHENPKKKLKKTNSKSLVQYIDLNYSEQNPNVGLQVGCLIIKPGSLNQF